MEISRVASQCGHVGAEIAFQPHESCRIGGGIERARQSGHQHDVGHAAHLVQQRRGTPQRIGQRGHAQLHQADHRTVEPHDQRTVAVGVFPRQRLDRGRRLGERSGAEQERDRRQEYSFHHGQS
jgi:hypothetical protein